MGIPLAVYFVAINPTVVYLARYLKKTPFPETYREAWGMGPLWFRVAATLVMLFPFIMGAMQWSGALDAGLDVVNGGPHWQAAVFAFWEPFVCVGVSMKLISVFRERFNETNGLTKWMSASAYTVYILHPLFVIVATWTVMGLSIPVLAKAIVMALLAVPSCFVVANQIRKIPPLPQFV